MFPAISILRKLPQGSMILIVVACIGVLLAYGREAVIAYYFGVTAELDAFLVALSLPQLIATQAGMATVYISMVKI